jgi:hypothetical protein
MKPLWLLDIDGVVNSPTPEVPTEVWDDWVQTSAWSPSGTWQIHTAVPVRDFITHVHESGLAEIRWHSTWQEFSVNVGDAVGLPRFPIQDAPEAHKYGFSDARWWKLPAVWRELLGRGPGGNRPVLWTDDDMDCLTGEQQTALTAAGCKLVRPNFRTGLNAEDLKEIETYLLQYATPPAS